MITLAAGRMGFEPQPRPGRVAFWLIISVPALILLAVIALFIGTALSG
jgi:hypothetical protein